MEEELSGWWPKVKKVCNQLQPNLTKIFGVQSYPNNTLDLEEIGSMKDGLSKVIFATHCQLKSTIETA